MFFTGTPRDAEQVLSEQKVRSEVNSTLKCLANLHRVKELGLVE